MNVHAYLPSDSMIQLVRECLFDVTSPVLGAVHILFSTPHQNIYILGWALVLFYRSNLHSLKKKQKDNLVLNSPLMCIYE